MHCRMIQVLKKLYHPTMYPDNTCMYHPTMSMHILIIQLHFSESYNAPLSFQNITITLNLNLPDLHDSISNFKLNTTIVTFLILELLSNVPNTGHRSSYGLGHILYYIWIANSGQKLQEHCYLCIDQQLFSNTCTIPL